MLQVEPQTSKNLTARPTTTEGIRRLLLIEGRSGVFGALAFIVLTSLQTLVAAAPPLNGPPQRVLSQIAEKGTARVLVKIRDAGIPADGSLQGLPAQATSTWRERRDRLLQRLPAVVAAKAKLFTRLPLIALETDADSLITLQQDDDVVAVFEDQLHSMSLASSGQVIGSDVAHAGGQTGAGTYVAILDTGVNTAHEFFRDKDIEEACFSTTYAPAGATTTCPGGSDVQFGAGAATPCSAGGCDHGTHVAGIAAGDGRSVGQPSGVAPDANLIAIQVFSYFPSGVAAYTSDIVQAMEYVFDLKNLQGLNVAAVNLSLGGDPESTAYACDTNGGSSSPEKMAVDLLRSSGIATVAAAGNSAAVSGISSPACVSSAIAVGATTDSDVIASYSNRGSWLGLMAPGSSIRSSTAAPSTYGNKNGTSMATPQVTGAIALLKSAADAGGIVGSDDVGRLLATLTKTGPVIFDSATVLEYPRLQVDSALAEIEGGSLAYEQILDTDYDGLVASGGFAVVQSGQSYRGRYVLSSAPAGDNRYRFDFDLPEPGYYAVSAWWPPGVGAQFSYQLTAGGANYAGIQDQGADGGRWMNIGMFPVQAPGQGYLEFVDDQGSQLAVDAIRITAVPTVVLLTTALPSGAVGSAYEYQLQAGGGEPPYAWTRVTGTLPDGITLSANGRLSGLPTAAGSATVGFKVTDATGTSDQGTFVLTVAPDNLPPVLSVIRPADGAEFVAGNAVTFEAVASDPESGDLSSQVVWQSSLDGSFGSGATVIASALSVGTHIITASVADGEGGNDQQTVSVTIVAASGGTAVDFGAATLLSHPDQDIAGSAVVEDGGATLYLHGNTWKRLPLPYQVKANTVLEFDFRRDVRGEIHAIGFDNGETGVDPDRTRFFAVDGTQNWGIRTYAYAGGGDWQHFRIPVGEHFGGQFANLVFTMDDDASAQADSRFRNVFLFDEQ